jgi:iron complex outermembrane receptor protein
MKTFKTISPLFISLWAMTGGASASDREDDALLSAPVQSLAPITVTALKHAGNMQDVPLSIQAFSGSELAAQGITNTQQLASVVPSMLFTSIAGFPIVFLRGLGTDNFVPSCDPSISTYIDGIYLPNGVAMFISLAGVKSVEVLKGPQGTLCRRYQHRHR